MADEDGAAAGGAGGASGEVVVVADDSIEIVADTMGGEHDGSEAEGSEYDADDYDGNDDDGDDGEEEGEYVDDEGVSNGDGGGDGEYTSNDDVSGSDEGEGEGDGEEGEYANDDADSSANEDDNDPPVDDPDHGASAGADSDSDSGTDGAESFMGLPVEEPPVPAAAPPPPPAQQSSGYAGVKRRRGAEDGTGTTAAASSSSSGGEASGSAPWHLARGGRYTSLPEASPLLRLHQEVLEFAEFMSPTVVEQEICDHALAAVMGVIRGALPEARVEIFGSRSNCLVLPTSDWDIVLFGVTPKPATMHSLGAALRRSDVTSHVEVIASARVPIIKAKEKLSGIVVDISFDATSGVASRELINDYTRRYPALRPLALVLKYFLLQRGLNETYRGGVGSFMLVLMIVHVIQQATLTSPTLRSAAAAAAPAAKRPRGGGGGGGGGEGSSASGSGGGVTQLNDLNLGMLLVAFLELYGFNLNYATTGISVRGEFGGYLRKPAVVDGEVNKLFIESPLDTSVDVGRNSFNMSFVRRAFAAAHTGVASAMREWRAYTAAAGSRKRGAPPPSLLSTIVHIDPLLALRGRELAALAAEEADAGDDSGDDDSIAAAVDARRGAARSSSAPPVPLGAHAPAASAPVSAEAAVHSALESLEAAPVVVRHKRLLADLFTRKERGVEEMARQYAADGWY